jgi:GntR family transcriptional regulator, rspAB operon transcriptional repressor
MIFRRKRQTLRTATSLRLRPLDQFSGSLAHRVYLSLKDAILSLAYRPGEACASPRSATRWAYPAARGRGGGAAWRPKVWCDVVPQAGTFVARFSMDEIREGAFLREALELAAVERVAETITEDQLVLLRRNLRLQAALVADGDFPASMPLDAEMHELILSFTGFRRLAGVGNRLGACEPRAATDPAGPGRVQATLAEHQAILAALEARDPEAARTATRHHLRQLIPFSNRWNAPTAELFAAV